LVKNQSAKVLNQALIEIGSTICLSKNPKCLICPLSESCVAFKQRLTDQLPLQKQKRLSEYWIWTPKVFENGKAWGLVSNDYAPFLRGQLIWPGEAKKVKTPPSHFDFQHSITHHKIFIQVQTAKTSGQSKVKSALKEKIKWIKKEDLKKNAPASLISKVLEHY
jgi:A/G-specific adenine glycosylase